MFRFFLIITVICLSAASGSQEEKHDPLPLATLKELPLLPELHAVHQFSSCNKKGENGDSQWCLYKDENNDSVIFDVQGPGCVRSMWGTDIREGAEFKFYFDGEETPRYQVPMLDFYQGKHPLFPPPLVSYERRGRWGERPFAGNCFVPIPFAQSLKISVSGHLEFYHILFTRYPHGSKVKTFSGKEDRTYLLDGFNKMGEAPYPFENTARHSKTLDDLPPGKTCALFDFDEPGCIRELVIQSEASDALMQEVVIQLCWDNIYPYSVQAPLGYFFGSAVHATEMRTLPLRVERLHKGKVKLTSWFPMPFWERARIELVNRSEKEIGKITAGVLVGPNPYPQNRSGYFTTCFRKGMTTHGRDWLFFESPGAGWFMGAVQTMLGEHYCEGDERIYLDNAISPQINGTGSEDYYLACFWPNLNFNSPFANCVGDIQEEGGGQFHDAYTVPSCYSRFHLEAPIPFFSRLDARIQHGGLSAINSQYGSLGFAYLCTQPRMTLTDFIDVGNKTSEALHNYKAPQSKLTGDLIAHPEGCYFKSRVQENGRQHDEGTITFHVAIHPNNWGVRLRRRLNQTQGRQWARVFINNEPAGVWYDPRRNEHLQWFDSDFDLHPSFTQGKEKLEVKLETDSFTDFRYEVFSLTQ